jgi:hypothetical protein
MREMLKYRICGNSMMLVTALLAAVAFVALASVAAQDKKPLEKIMFPSKQGATTFLHARHIEREKGNCANCHDKPWAQTAEPLKNSFGCHTCHKPDGKAFNAGDRANCERCHPAGSEKTP